MSAPESPSSVLGVQNEIAWIVSVLFILPEFWPEHLANAWFLLANFTVICVPWLKFGWSRTLAGRRPWSWRCLWCALGYSTGVLFEALNCSCQQLASSVPPPSPTLFSLPQEISGKISENQEPRGQKWLEVAKDHLYDLRSKQRIKLPSPWMGTFGWVSGAYNPQIHLSKAGT